MKRQRQAKKALSKVVVDRIRVGVAQAMIPENRQPVVLAFTSEESIVYKIYYPSSAETGEWLLRTLKQTLCDDGDVHVHLAAALACGSASDVVETFERYFGDRIGSLEDLGRFRLLSLGNDWVGVGVDPKKEDAVSIYDLTLPLFFQLCLVSE